MILSYMCIFLLVNMFKTWYSDLCLYTMAVQSEYSTVVNVQSEQATTCLFKVNTK